MSFRFGLRHVSAARFADVVGLRAVVAVLVRRRGHSNAAHVARALLAIPHAHAVVAMIFAHLSAAHLCVRAIKNIARTRVRTRHVRGLRVRPHSDGSDTQYDRTLSAVYSIHRRRRLHLQRSAHRV